MRFVTNHPRLITALIVAAFFGMVSAAQAADPPAILGPMADGRYFTALGGGMLDQSKDDLMARIAAVQAGSPDPGVSAPTPTEAATSTAADPWADPPEVPASAPAPAPPALLSAIQRGRQLLLSAIDADAGKKPKIVTSYGAWVDVTLAVWDRSTDQIQLVHAGKSGAKLDIDKDADVGLSVRFDNGINTQFAVDDGDKVVVAVRYPIFKDVTVTRRHPKYQLQDVVYTPYSAPLHTPELVAAGEQTLRGNIAEAEADLRAGGVMSRAFPGKPVADVIDPKLVEAIAVIEHLGGASLLGSDAQDAADSFYVTVAANQDDAYAYSRSTAGARGLVQFIPSTYALMAKRSDLGLIKDFVAGMADPVNAIKAQIAYLDAELADMPLSVKDLYAVDPARVDEYLAAAYNGGDTRVRKAIAALGDGWSADPTAQKAALQRQYDTLFSEAAALKRKILAENDPAVWKPMQKRLEASRVERAHVKARMDALAAASLHQETAVYVQKLRAMLKLLTPPPVPEA